MRVATQKWAVVARFNGQIQEIVGMYERWITAQDVADLLRQMAAPGDFTQYSVEEDFWAIADKLEQVGPSISFSADDLD